MFTEEEVLELYKLERKFDLGARERLEVPGTSSTVDRSWEEQRPFDADVQAGDVRLLSHGLTTGHRNIVFVAILGLGAVDEDDKATRWVMTAPFSPYDHPGFPGEWATGLDSPSLRVLQLWNTQPFPVDAIGKSWKVGTLPTETLDTARRLYSGQVSPCGFAAPGQGTGVADEEYMIEEFELLAPLHAAMEEVIQGES